MTVQRLRSIGGSGTESPWLGADAKDYDPNGFYVRSVDTKRAKGESSELRMRIPKELAGAITTLIASGALGGTPIHTIDHFVRDAIVHQMHRISQMVNDEVFAEAARLQRELAVADGHRREGEMLMETIQAAEEGFAGAKKNEDRELAKRLLVSYESVVERIRQPYRKRLVAQMKAARQWVESGE